MMWKRLKACFIKPVQNSVGEAEYPKLKSISECYAKLNTAYRCQGDVYPESTFAPGSFPTSAISYWGIINRTCHLYESATRPIKLQFLTYAAVVPLREAVVREKKLKDQVSSIINGKSENLVLLPTYSGEYDVSEPLVFNFNILYTLPIGKCPSASDKCIQLTSPFSEYVFQKMARYFYTVGYDDEQIKAPENIDALIKYLQDN